MSFLLAFRTVSPGMAANRREIIDLTASDTYSSNEHTLFQVKQRDDILITDPVFGYALNADDMDGPLLPPVDP